MEVSPNNQGDVGGSLSRASGRSTNIGAPRVSKTPANFVSSPGHHHADMSTWSLAARVDLIQVTIMHTAVVLPTKVQRYLHANSYINRFH
jgi:hypothetical protein